MVMQSTTQTLDLTEIVEVLSLVFTKIFVI